jgi:hypothetical protein
MGQALGIVYRCIAAHLVKKAGFACRTAQTGAVTLIQRFGSALNLNIHFHMLFLDGVYVERPDGSLRFRWVKAPTSAGVTHLTHTLAHRIGRFLERQGLLERDAENNYFAADAVDEDSMAQLLGHSITYRIAVGPQQGRKVFTLQTLPACDEPFDDPVGKAAGFSLHAGVAAAPRQPDIGASRFAAGKPGAAGRPVWLSPSNPSPHSNGSCPKGSQATGWPDARCSRASDTGEGDWLGSECGITQGFGVLEGRSSLRYRYMIR